MLLQDIASKMVNAERQYSKASLGNMSIQLESTSEKLESIRAMLVSSVDSCTKMSSMESRS